MTIDMVEIDQKQQLPAPSRNSQTASVGTELGNPPFDDLSVERLGTGSQFRAPGEIVSAMDPGLSQLGREDELNLPLGVGLEEFDFPADPVGVEVLNLGSSRHYSPVEQLGLDLSELAAQLDVGRLGEPVLNHMQASAGRPYAIEAPREVTERFGTPEVQVNVSRLPHSNGQDCLYRVTVLAQPDAEHGVNPLSGRTTVGSFVVDHRGQQPEIDRTLPVAARNIRNDFDSHANNAELAYWLPKVMSA